MNRLFASALLSAIALANEAEDDFELMQYAAKFNKTYNSVAEMVLRRDILKKSRDARAEYRKAHPKAIFGDTHLSDATDQEYDAMNGFWGDLDDDRRLDEETFPEPEGRQLQAFQDFDWTTTGNMTPVKNQGGCGSCWAFCATTVLEAMVSIQNNNATPVRLSEQQGVDCSDAYGNGGCNGGWMASYYRFSNDLGSMSNADYPYTATDGACQQTADSTIVARADYSRFVSLGRSPTVSQIYNAMQNGPMTIALNAGPMWRDYRGGVLSADVTTCDPLVLNHGVTLVGFKAGTTTAEEITTTTDDTITTVCTPASKDEKRSQSCAGEGQTYVSRKCCRQEVIPGTTTTEIIYTTTDSSWKVQNSWGSGWGDQGFIHFEAIEGYGVCGMNRYVEGIYVQ